MGWSSQDGLCLGTLLTTGSDDYLSMPFIVNTLRWHTEIFVVYPATTTFMAADRGEGDFLSERLSRNTSLVLFLFI